MYANWKKSCFEKNGCSDENIFSYKISNFALKLSEYIFDMFYERFINKKNISPFEASKAGSPLTCDRQMNRCSIIIMNTLWSNHWTEFSTQSHEWRDHVLNCWTYRSPWKIWLYWALDSSTTRKLLAHDFNNSVSRRWKRNRRSIKERRRCTLQGGDISSTASIKYR